MIDHVGAVRGRSRPNILFIITDQQRGDAVGYINSFVSTPFLDKLASESVVCDNTFVQSPQCQPSRASIFTGRYPTAHKVWWNEVDVPISEKTIANYLSNVGYKTAYFGKLHFDGIGGHSKVAQHFGFQTSYLFEDWQQWVSARSLSIKGIGPVANEFYGPMAKGPWVGEFTRGELHHEEVVTEKAVEFISENSGKEPWFVTVGFHGPHPPYASPVEFSSRYDLDSMAVPDGVVYANDGYKLTSDDWRRLKRQYYGAISWIDNCIGRLLSVVDDNTIVVFTSDHGDILGDHNLFSKGLFAYDGNVKVPLIVRIPGVDGRVYSHLVQSIDIVPTLLGLVGVKIPNQVQGVNLLPGFLQNKPLTGSVLSMIGHSSRLRMIRNLQFKYWIMGDSEFLFDLVNDPFENINIVNSNPVALSLLRLQLIRGLVRAEDPVPLPRH